MIANIGSISSVWPRSGNAFAFHRRPYWSRQAAGTTGGWADLGKESPILPHQEQIHADKLGITLQFRDYTIDKLGVMAQKAEKILLKIINEWLCNVQLFPKI